MPAIPQIPTLEAQELTGKWHTTIDTALALCCGVVVFFALLILYVVTHMNTSHLSELKAMIRAQGRELRKLKKKNAERALLIKDKNGNARFANCYGTLEDAKKQEQIGKILASVYTS